MTLTEYIANLNRIKAEALSNWGVLTEAEQEIFSGSYDWLIDNLEINRGEVVVDEQLSQSMDEFLSAVVKIVNNAKTYKAKVTGFLADLANIQKNNIAFHATANGFNAATAGVSEVQKLVVDEVLNQYLDNGLNSHFAAPLRDNIFRNILAGANMKEVREVLRNYIIGGQDGSGKLGQYLKQTAQMAVDSYSGAINQELVKTFTFTGYVISGSLIETSSKQCIYAVDNSVHGYLSFKEWEEVLDIARANPKAKLIPGTTLQNLPLNKLHWGCRHDFTPIIKKAGKTGPAPDKLPKPPQPDNLKKSDLTTGQVLAPIEEKIRLQKFESAAIVKDGVLLLFKDGEASKVSFSPEQTKIFPGAVLTHNHPSSRSFSKADITLFIKHDLEEVRAISELADYSVKRGDKFIKLTTEQVLKKYNAADRKIHKLFSEKMINGQMTIEEANANHHHEVMLLIQKTLNLIYKRDLR